MTISDKTRVMRRSVAVFACASACATVCLAACPPADAADAARFDIVIAGGRVIDPESGLDAVRDVGLRGSVVAAVSPEPLTGSRRIDAQGLVVAPGFIDLHNHAFAPRSQEFRVRDGVTTALELEAGALDIDGWYGKLAGRSRFNFGASASHYEARVAAIELTTSRDIGEETPESDYVDEPSTGPLIAAVMARLQDALDAGAIGIGYMPEYMPGTSHEEGLRVFQLAAANDTLVFSHQRYGSMAAPGTWLEAVQELVANAALTGAPIHICHVTSMNLSATPLVLGLLDGARTRGVDVTTEVYPYTRWSTGLDSAVFAPGWQARYEIDYADLTLATTGETLTRETFERYRGRGLDVVAAGIPEAAVKAALSHPGVIIVSDAGDIVTGNEHPRGAGTNGRVLGYYVREHGVLSLVSAIRKMTLLPARRLESVAPQMRRKGRIQQGMDADIVVFDPLTVTDNAQFGAADRFSTGFEHVIVNGQIVVENGSLQPDALPGRPVRAAGQ